MSYIRFYYHLVWSTKNRLPLILPDFEERLHKAMVAKCLKLEGTVFAIGGVENHIHLAVAIPPQIAVAKFVAQLKGTSSHFVNHEVQPGFGFYWQSEYGALTFGKANLELVTNYIANQRQHHNENTLYHSMEQS